MKCPQTELFECTGTHPDAEKSRSARAKGPQPQADVQETTYRESGPNEDAGREAKGFLLEGRWLPREKLC